MGRVTAVNPLGHTAVPGSFVTHHSILCPDVGDIAAILVGLIMTCSTMPSEVVPTTRSAVASVLWPPGTCFERFFYHDNLP